MCANLTLRSWVAHPGEVDEGFKRLTAPEYLLERAAYWKSKGNPLLSIDGITGEEIHFGDFLDWSDGVASWFWKHGLKHGDVVLYLIENFTKLSAFFTGVWRANGVVKACYPEELKDTLRERVVESRCGFIYCEEDKAEICLGVANSIPDWKIRVIVNNVTTIPGCTPVSELFLHKGEVPKLEISGDDGALILCTSGTTGRCKGALRNHRSLVNLIKCEEMYPWDRRSMLVCKGTHISGSCFPLGNLALGICSVIVWKATWKTIFGAISRYKPTVLFGFPGYLLWLVEEERRREFDLTSLEKLFTAGVVLNPAIKEKLLTLPNVKQVLNIYGMTESSHFLSNCEKLDSKNFRGIDVPGNIVGKAAPGGQIQIRDPNTGNPLGPWQHGEVHVKHVDMFSEYINSTRETMDAFTNDGWFKTGDIGFYDENEFVTIVGRRKEIFKYFNNHISPNYIDDVIKEHPSVKEACTIGITHIDGFNSVPRVFITLKEGHEVAMEEEIRSYANERLPDHMQLRGGLYVVQDMPKGNTGKVTREAVARLYAQA